MIRQDLCAGLLVWLPNNDENREVIILDYKRNTRGHVVHGQFEVYMLTIDGNIKAKSKTLELKDAFFLFLEMIGDDKQQAVKGKEKEAVG